MTKDEEALRGLCDRYLAKEMYLIEFAQACHALGRASGWQAGSEAQREADIAIVAPRTIIYPEIALRDARLVTDDQRASVSGGDKCEHGLWRDSCRHGCAGPSESVPGERDGERCACGLYEMKGNMTGLSDETGAHRKPVVVVCTRNGVPLPSKPTDRNAGRDAALLRDFVKLWHDEYDTSDEARYGKENYNGFIRHHDPCHRGKCSAGCAVSRMKALVAAVEDALKGGGE